MIQRFQSVFLLLCSGSLGSAFLFPFARSIDKSQTFFADGLFDVHDNLVILVILAVTAIMSLITIFLYNNRKMQLNLCILVFLLIGALSGMLINFFYQFNDFSFELGIAAPVLALIFSILAFIFIRKDDNLVKSMDRLR